MPLPTPTFLDALLAGTATEPDIYDYVEAWHDGDGKTPIHTFLGMTEAEYARWAVEPSELTHIIAARR
jgi:hypothetical protein